MKTRKLLVTLAVLAVVSFLPAAAKADPVTFVLDASQAVLSGGNVNFNGSLSNGGAPNRFIFDVSVTIDGPAGAFTFDFAPLFAAYPGAIPAGGPSVVIFNVMADGLLAPGTYNGSLTVLLSDEEFENIIEVTKDFSITVRQGTEPIPEPATMLLLGSGLAGLAAARRRRRRQASTIGAP